MEELTNPIQLVFKKNSRDRARPVRLVTAACMFKLLDKFSEEKNSAAPIIYKALIFAIIESPEEQTVREMYLLNFTQLFSIHQSVPIKMLLEPLIKANQVQDTFFFCTFDYDFLTFVAKHPRLKVENSIQMLDLLARHYLNDVCNASAAAVPFMIICSRFCNEFTCQEFILKFITICLNQLLALDALDVPPPPKKSKSKSSKSL